MVFCQAQTNEFSPQISQISADGVELRNRQIICGNLRNLRPTCFPLYYKHIKPCSSDTIFLEGTGGNRENGDGHIDGRDLTLFPLFFPVPGLVAAAGRVKFSVAKFTSQTMSEKAQIR